MNIIRLYEDFRIDYVTEGHKHSRPGWVNAECPFCTGNPGYHLGYELESNYFYCWRCGWHPIIPTISKLTNFSEKETHKIVRQYGLLISKAKVTSEPTVQMKEHRMPSGIQPLSSIHKQYLIKRGFNPDQLEREWKLVGTGPVSILDHIDFKHRIIIPIIWNDKAVSFTSRDITNKHNLRYISCPKDRELIHHKEILYGQQSKWNEVGICVEGPTDVWRFGSSAFCTFGIKYTPSQLRLISKIFKRVPVCFDSDPQAIAQANQLVADLRFRGVDAFRIEIEGDPGSMKQEEADYLIKQLL